MSGIFAVGLTDWTEKPFASVKGFFYDAFVTILCSGFAEKQASGFVCDYAETSRRDRLRHEDF